MKISLLLSAALCACAACAAPLTFEKALSEANPFSWRVTPKTIESLRGGDGLLTASTPKWSQGSVSVRLTPRDAATNTWSTMGVALVDDARNFWHLALVQAPASDGGQHFFELSEMRDGGWLSQFADKLICSEHRQEGSWAFGGTYDMTLAVDVDGIHGEVRSAEGKLLFACRFAFRTQTGTAPAVRTGRPALHVTGGFTGAFSKPDGTATAVLPESKSAADPAFPPYESESFTPSVHGRATGFFRVERQGPQNRWWVIDPLGRGTVLLGVDHVTYGGHWCESAKRRFHHEVNLKKFPVKADWETNTLERLKAWGFNMLGAGCDPALRRRGLIHTIFLSVGDGLCRDDGDDETWICPNEHRPCSAFPNVFHPQFEQWCDWVARRNCAPNRNDPWLFGYFIDNELAWWGRGLPATGLFEAVMKLRDDHSAKIALKKFLKDRGVTGSPDDDVKLAFLKKAAERYFSCSAAAIRRHDPNHLVMGARFAGIGGAHPAVWEISGKYCDVVTFNCYPWADLDRNVVFEHQGLKARRITEAFDAQYRLVNRPVLITEWSFPALDSGLPCTAGAGQRFRTQRERTAATELFAKTMLSLPFLIGYDYFMWVDEPAAGISQAFPEDSNYGLINEQGDAYPEITQMFTKLQRDAGAWRCAPVPAERPVPARSGLSAAAARSRLGTPGGVSFTREKNVYRISNGSGLVAEGRLGGPAMLTSVRLNERLLGRYTAMLNWREKGDLTWQDIGEVTAVSFREENGYGVLSVTGTGRRGETVFTLTHELTFFAGKPYFLCELTKAVNSGTTPIDVNAFYFRQYTDYAQTKRTAQTRSVPNLWKELYRDRWLDASNGTFFGGLTSAPTVSMLRYFLGSNGKSVHPDAMFEPASPLTLVPGAVYEPKGQIWMLAVGGTDGQDGWLRMTDAVTQTLSVGE